MGKKGGRERKRKREEETRRDGKRGEGKGIAEGEIGERLRGRNI